jgi:hypothetical protein
MQKSLFDELDDRAVRDSLRDPPPPPVTVTSFLGRLTLLHGVPLPYLVADEKLLPPESLKFFHVDPQWINALVSGALSVGRGGDVRLLLNKTMAGNFVRGMITEARAARNRARDIEHAADPPDPASADVPYTFTGFLLRSRIIAGWPGLEIKAYRSTNRSKSDELALLRLERLAADVLLGLVDGPLVDLELAQPPEGLHFVVKADFPLRDVNARVLDMPKLADDLGCRSASSAALAARLIASQLRFTFSLEA